MPASLAQLLEELQPKDMQVFLRLSGRRSRKGVLLVTHQQLADEEGCGRLSIAKRFARLRKRGLVRSVNDPRKGQYGVVLNPYVLRHPDPVVHGLEAASWREAGGT